MRSAQALLSLRAITCARAPGREPLALLDGVTLDVWPGEHVAILGGRRQGKTTLLRVAAGVEAPDAGTVALDGEELGALSRGERTRRLRSVGYVPKAWRVARGKPAVDHVALPLLAAGRPLVTAFAKAHETLERVGATHCAGTPAEQLPPADVTRVALAQALVQRPRVLLADEPGAMAEPDEREELLRLLRTIAGEQRELALVVSSRDVAGVAGATRVLTLGDGELRGEQQPSEAEVLPFPVRPRHGASGPRVPDPAPAT